MTWLDEIDNEYQTGHVADFDAHRHQSRMATALRLLVEVGKAAEYARTIPENIDLLFGGRKFWMDMTFEMHEALMKPLNAAFANPDVCALLTKPEGPAHNGGDDETE